MKRHTLILDDYDLHRVLTALAWTAGIKSGAGNVADANLFRCLYNDIGRATLGAKHKDFPMETMRKVASP